MATAIQNVVRSVMYQFQRVDAFLLDTLYSNVQRMQQRAIPPGSNGRIRNGELHRQLPSWTAEGFRKLEFNDVDAVALQVAPWTFITSPYSFSLIFMAILLNRMQHVITPPHRARAARVHSWMSWLVPINPSSTLTRFVLRSIPLYLLWKSLIRLFIIVLQGYQLFPTGGFWEPVARWASMVSMLDVCWSCFVAVCSAMIVSTFNRCLDGTQPPLTSFNLPQYAFLLHLYSSPLGSVFNRIPDPSQGQVPAPRPNRHVLISMLLPLLQMTLIHTQGIWKRHTRSIFAPTAFCGLISMAHFIQVLWVGEIMEYPLLQMVPSFLELFLASVILLTLTLNTLSQFLQYGGLIRPLFMPGAGALPSHDEEFCLVLVRLGTSSIDASHAAGLGNEVAPIATSLQKEDTINLGPSGVLAIEGASQATTQSASRRRRITNPFKREIKHVRPVSAESEAWINFLWMKEFYRFSMTLWRYIKAMWTAIRTRSGLNSPRDGDTASPAASNARNAQIQTNSTSQQSPELYSRFLAGEEISDDTESDFEEESASRSSSSSTSSASDHEDDLPRNSDRRTLSPTPENWEARETQELFSEHGSQRSQSPLAPVLLAHLTTPVGTQLTRRRYSSMLLGEPSGREIASTIAFSSSVSQLSGQATFDEETQASTARMCVICLSNERIVICWPCRCLSMCEDCRGNLASRSGPNRHSCPCCRQSVDGFSRIFIP